jgi:hypothetical protein
VRKPVHSEPTVVTKKVGNSESHVSPACITIGHCNNDTNATKLNSYLAIVFVILLTSLLPALCVESSDVTLKTIISPTCGQLFVLTFAALLTKRSERNTRPFQESIREL